MSCIKKMNTDSEVLEKYRKNQRMNRKKSSQDCGPFKAAATIVNFPSVEELNEEYTECSPFFRPQTLKFELENQKKLVEEA